LADVYGQVDIKHRHAVLVFTPPQELVTLAAQGRTNEKEYARIYKWAIQDPGNWQPLNPVMTFKDYQPTYGFGGPRAPLVRVVEGNATYESKNHRYRTFMEEVRRSAQKVELTDTDEACFAWCRYRQQSGVNMDEWRPATCIPKEVQGGGRKFLTSWVHAPPQPQPAQG